MPETTNKPLHRECRDCGEDFEMEAAEIEWYKAHRLALPARCKACRDWRKYERQTR